MRTLAVIILLCAISLLAVVVTDNATLTVPTDLVTKVVNGRHLVMRCEASPEATGYRIMTTTNLSTWTVAAELPAGPVEWHTPFTDERMRFFTLVATNADGETWWTRK